MDFGESGVLREVEEVPFVEGQHRIRVHRLDAFERRHYLLCEILDRRHVVAEEKVWWAGQLETIDRLKDRDPPARLQHAKELAKGPPLVPHVDQDRPRSNDVHRSAKHREIVGGSEQELAPSLDAHLFGEHPAVVEQVPGDVAEDDVPVFPHEIEGPEGYKAVARPDVKQGLAPLHGGVLQNTVPPGQQSRQERLLLPRVAPETTLQQPLGPFVSNRPGHESSYSLTGVFGSLPRSTVARFSAARAAIFSRVSTEALPMCGARTRFSSSSSFG